SWAADPSLRYDPALAGTLAEKAQLKGVKLELKYPSDDLRVRPAMEYLRDSVRNELGGNVELELKGVPWRQLRHDVEVSHDYQLAYYCYDHPSDAFWLWPLFRPNQTTADGREVGTNYLGYANDGQVAELFGKMNARRDFRELQKWARTLDAALF